MTIRMKNKINIRIFAMLSLLTVAFAGCSFSVGTNTNTSAPANKPSPANTTAPANANKPANTNAPANTASDANKTDTSSKDDGKSNPELDFTIVNKTGYAIKALSVGPSGVDEWKAEDEVLKGRTFADGGTLDIKFSPKAKSAKWDILVEWADGSESVEWTGFDLTTINKLTLHYDRATDKTTADIE